MAYKAILKRIRLLIPTKLDRHYKRIRRGFEEGDLTAPSLGRFRNSLVFRQMKPRSRDVGKAPKPEELTCALDVLGIRGTAPVALAFVASYLRIVLEHARQRDGQGFAYLEQARAKAVRSFFVGTASRSVSGTTRQGDDPCATGYCRNRFFSST
jgi:hypothetical protein